MKDYSLDEIKERWYVTVIVAGMGNIHDPEVKPFVIVRGAKWEKVKSWDVTHQMVTKKIGDETWGLKNMRFSALIANGDPKIFYSNKAVEAFSNEAQKIIDNWGEWKASAAGETKNVIKEIAVCHFCRMKKVPGHRLEGYSQSHSVCVLCMAEATANWLSQEKEKL